MKILSIIVFVLTFSAAGIIRAESCLDFSGDWKGSCTFTDRQEKSIPYSIHISQNSCASIFPGSDYLKKEEYTFGVPRVFRDKNSGEEFINQGVVNWKRYNGIGSEIHVNFNNSSFATGNNGDNGLLSSRIGYETYSMDGSDLVVRVHYSSSWADGSGSSLKDTSGICRYRK